MPSQSPRFYAEQPVEPTLLARILKEATLSPSPYNLQPWRFVVVRDAAGRRGLQSCARNHPLIGLAPVVVVVLGYLHAVETHLDASLAQRLELGACGPEQAAEIRGRARAALGRAADRSLGAIRSGMLAAAALMSSAEAAGLSSAFLDAFDEEALRARLGVPDDHAVCCLIALGRAAQAEPFAGRFGLDEVCYSEHFGQPWSE